MFIWPLFLKCMPASIEQNGRKFADDILNEFLDWKLACFNLHPHEKQGAVNPAFFRVIGPLCGEFTGKRWIRLTKASDAEIWFFHLRLNKRLSKQSKRGDSRRHRAH